MDFSAQSAGISSGMTIAEVEAILGRPNARKLNGDQEIWNWSDRGWFDTYSYWCVWFQAGKVRGMGGHLADDPFGDEVDIRTEHTVDVE